MHEFLNIAAYRFVPLDDLATLRPRLLEMAQTAGLRGKIVLASEGINLFLAGEEAGVRSFLATLRADARFAGLTAKESWSHAVPFRRMLVKLRPEIIRMNHPAIQPDPSREGGRAPAVDAVTLRRWLGAGHDDSGRPVVALDTRNAFEVEQGTFRGAIDWKISRFTQFPEALAAHRDQLVGKTVVSFCTGGIRCEKAAILMREQGLEHSYQLEGGILQYFEDTDGAHWDGTCFVFDERIALQPDLSAI